MAALRGHRTKGERSEARREAFLSFYGPSSLLLLVGLWAMILVLGFATLQWAGGSVSNAAEPQRDFATDLYFSGTTFLTLGLGDVRSVYEPYLEALSEHLLMGLPPWVPAPGATDNWESTAWDFAPPVPLLGPDSPFASGEPDHG